MKIPGNLVNLILEYIMQKAGRCSANAEPSANHKVVDLAFTSPAKTREVVAIALPHEDEW